MRGCSVKHCGDSARYHAAAWGQVSRDLDLCEDHAVRCMLDGWPVMGPNGGALAYDDDGNLTEIET